MGTKVYVDKTYQAGAAILGPPDELALPSVSPATEGRIGYDTTADQPRYRGPSNVVNLGPLVHHLAADSAEVTSTPLDLLTVTLPNVGTYHFRAWAIHMMNTADAGVTVGLGVNGTSTPSAYRWTGIDQLFAVGTAHTAPIRQNGTTTYGAPVTLGIAETTALAPHAFIMEGTVTITAVGTFTIRMSRIAGNGTNGAVFASGSLLVVQQVN